MSIDPRLTMKFSDDDYYRACEQWGANCGPGAIAAILDTTLDKIRPHLKEFEYKHYTNPRLMFSILSGLGVRWNLINDSMPLNGLMRVQWEGPWTDPGVPRRKRYRHSHWIAIRRVKGNLYAFDINCVTIGGWVPYEFWHKSVVPWLLDIIEPGAYGTWHPTHRLEIFNVPYNL